ncbi:hypothetical protein BO99DRAFT_259275 [Aspergillus violaceofuscus CBS 115571]|uniref:Uncharacterized protein n=1 Tax=Aspergillus violaceofuscus (strain CBS 115571) TaxID=1450538 RepID=A0A2V5HML7_ASPV1|nr:hypothetical protein BO99DRAFT_259275 [Aspergillus violaceofuscus CBS 115571]
MVLQSFNCQERWRHVLSEPLATYHKPRNCLGLGIFSVFLGVLLTSAYCKAGGLSAPAIQVLMFGVAV